MCIRLFPRSGDAPWARSRRRERGDAGRATDKTPIKPPINPQISTFYPLKSPKWPGWGCSDPELRMGPREDAPGTPSGLSQPNLSPFPTPFPAFCGHSQPLSSPKFLQFLLQTRSQGTNPVAKSPSEHPKSQIPGRNPHGSHTEEVLSFCSLFFPQSGEFCRIFSSLLGRMSGDGTGNIFCE